MFHSTKNESELKTNERIRPISPNAYMMTNTSGKRSFNTFFSLLYSSFYPFSEHFLENKIDFIFSINTNYSVCLLLALIKRRLFL